MPNRQQIETILSTVEKNYKTFMEINTFPAYKLELKQASLSNAENRGYEPVAQSRYDFQRDIHTLIVSTNLSLEEYLLFHEFTHIQQFTTFTQQHTVATVSF